MSKNRGPLARYAAVHAWLFIKPQPDCFDGTHFAIGYYKNPNVNGSIPEFTALVGYSRERDAKRALRNIGYVQEGNRWVHASTVLVKQEETEQ